MRWHELIAKLDALGISAQAEVFVSYPCATHDGRDTGPLDSLDLDDDGDLVLWVDV